MTHLKDVVDPIRFENFVKRGLIDSRQHPDNNNLRVYSYSKRVQYEGIWTPETRLARGLMLQFDETGDYANAQIVGRGIPKFFTVQQIDSDWASAKLIDDDENVTVDESPEIPWDAPAHLANKLNGALGLGYIAPDGEIAISTKGSFNSLEANIGSRVISEKLGEDSQKVKLLMRAGYTPLFEIITPERPHPVDYGNLEDIIYLGLVSHHDGTFFPADDNDILTLIGFTRAETMPFKTLREAVEAPYQPNTEGMIASINVNDVQHLFKIKPEEYLQLRKLFYSIQPKDLHSLMKVMTGEEIASITDANQVSLGDAEKALVNGHKKLADKHRKSIFEIVVKAQEIANEVIMAYDEIKATSSNDRKDIALKIKSANYDSSLLFSALADDYDGTKSVYRTAMRSLLK